MLVNWKGCTYKVKNESVTLLCRGVELTINPKSERANEVIKFAEERSKTNEENKHR